MLKRALDRRVTWDWTGPPPLVPVLTAPPPVLGPGDANALRRGCTCPRDANWRGAGATLAAWGLPPRAGPERVFLIDRDCPLHRALRVNTAS